MEEIRLNKYLASCGICSRRDADKLIEDGRVTVNNEVAKAGQKVTSADKVSVDGKAVEPNSSKVVIAYNKPRGVVVTERDEHAKVTISDVIDYPVRLTYAGRLDKDSEGLILLTNDGDFINAAMKARNYHEKEYIVTVDKEVTDEELDTLRNGVYLKELDVTTRSCKVERIGKCKYRVVLSQGLNRQIRRMFQAIGRSVVKLKRIRVITVELGDLKVGEYRELTSAEMTKLYDSVGLDY